MYSQNTPVIFGCNNHKLVEGLTIEYTCAPLSHLVRTHGHGDVLLGDLVVADVPHVVPRQLQDVGWDVLQHGHHVDWHLVVDLVTQHLLGETANTRKMSSVTCVQARRWGRGGRWQVGGTFSSGWILSTGSASGFLLFLFSMAAWASAIAHLSMGWGKLLWTRSCNTNTAGGFFCFWISLVTADRNQRGE